MVTGGKSVMQVLASIKRATRVAVMMDELEKLVLAGPAAERVSGTVSRLMQEFHSKAYKAEGLRQLSALIGNIKQGFGGGSRRK